MKHNPVKDKLPDADFSMSKEELESKVLALEIVVAELYHQVQAHKDLIRKLIIRTDPNDE